MVEGLKMLIIRYIIDTLLRKHICELVVIHCRISYQLFRKPTLVTQVFADPTLFGLR